MGKSTARRPRSGTGPPVRPAPRKKRKVGFGLASEDRDGGETVRGDSLDVAVGPPSASRTPEPGRQVEGSDLPAPSTSTSTSTVDGHRFQRIQLQKVSARQRKRVKHVDGWEVLVPTKGALSMLAAALPGTQRTCCKLYPLGAVFPSAELASRAADQALIALSGRLASEALLNWPLREYPEEECYQRFGPDLARFLIRLVNEGRVETEAAKRRLGGMTAKDEGRARKQARKIREQAASELLQEKPMYMFHLRPCGVCRPCRHPELGERCVRGQMNTRGYQPRQHALLEIEGVERRAYQIAIDDAKSRGDTDLRKRLQGRLTSVVDAVPTEEGAASGVDDGCGGGNRDGMRDASSPLQIASSYDDDGDEKVGDARSLCWLVEPTQMPGLHSTVFAKERQKRAMELGETVAAEASGVRRSVIASTKKNSWEIPAGAFPRGHPFDDILASRRLAEHESAELIESHADDHHATSSAERRCKWCGAKHHGSQTQKRCPFLQMALAFSTPDEPQCVSCADAPGASCSACLRGTAGLPPEVFSSHQPPLRQDAGCINWASTLPPAMLDLVRSIRGLASAAVSEFGAEHLTAQLTPDSLLAIAAIAETVIDEALRQSSKKRH